MIQSFIGYMISIQTFIGIIIPIHWFCGSMIRIKKLISYQNIYCLCERFSALGI